MAKTPRPTIQEETKKTVNTMYERNDYEQVGEKDVAFWDFEKNPTIHCTNVRPEKLEYDVFLVTDQESGEDYYLPAHDKIVKLFESGKASDEYKIEFLGKREFGKPDKHGDRKTYYSYNTGKAKK